MEFNNRLDIRLSYKKETGFYPGKPVVWLENQVLNNPTTLKDGKSKWIEYIEWLEDKIIELNKTR